MAITTRTTPFRFTLFFRNGPRALSKIRVTPTQYQCVQNANNVDWFIVYKLPGGKSSHYLLPNAAAAWTAAADIDAAQQPVHSTMNLYFASANRDRANIVAYSNYPPHFKFELPMSPGKGVIIAEEQNKGFWLVHTAKYFPNIAGTVATLFSNEKTTKDAAAFLCMSYSDVNLRAVAKIIDYEQPIIYFTQRSSVQATQAFYDSAEIQTLINGLHKYQPIGTVSADSIRTLTAPGTVKIFATAPVAYSSDIYSNYVVKILKKTLQVYTPGTTTTVLRKSCAGTLKVENVLGPITVSDTVIPIEQDSARWSVQKSDSDFVCLSNTGRTADDAKHGATVACILSADATTLFRSMITTQNLDACPPDIGVVSISVDNRGGLRHTIATRGRRTLAQLDGTTRDAVQNKNSQIMDPLFSKPGTKDRTPHLRHNSVNFCAPLFVRPEVQGRNTRVFRDSSSAEADPEIPAQRHSKWGESSGAKIVISATPEYSTVKTVETRSGIYCVGDEPGTNWSKWLIAKITDIHPSEDSVIRSATVKTKQGTVTWSARSLSLVEPSSVEKSFLNTCSSVLKDSHAQNIAPGTKTGIRVTPTQYQCVQNANNVDWFIVYKLPGGKSSHYLLPNAAAAWTGAADIDAAQQPVHSTMNLYFASGNKDRANIVAYSNYPPHFKFELPMSPGKGVIIAEEQNKGFWLVHTAKYFPNIAGTVATLFSNEKTTKDAAAFLCMSYSDVNLRAVAKIIDYEQPIIYFTQRSSVQATQAFYDSAEIQTLINGLHKYQPIGTVSADSIRTLTAPGTVKIFATAPVAYSSDIYSNYVVKILKKTLQVYTPGTTTTVLRKSCAGTLKVENVLGPITVSDTVIPIEQDSARWSVQKSDSDFVCLSNTGRTADDAKHGATVACILSADATTLFRSMITTQNLDACP
ncbi:Deoxyribonuclease-2-alpha [Trichinella pseudospiralis]|uniref:Deoxyribonuclease-2-alpha n=2 Tax=Trichinella pseudospiralis TaxID=6337 RepID=A0A0V1EMY8_TRIPS|nr:Deoxyribonuclease-2-alpha [Trichinella pseudospiralis]